MVAIAKRSLADQSGQLSSPKKASEPATQPTERSDGDLLGLFGEGDAAAGGGGAGTPEAGSDPFDMFGGN